MVGKSGSLNEVFERHYVAMIAWCRGHVQRRIGEPEEFVHLAYLRCHQRWSPSHQSSYNEASYLFRALRWVVLDACRKHVREMSRQHLPGRPDGSAQEIVLRNVVAQEAFGLLRGKQLQVCQGVMAGKDEEQICRELKLSRGAYAVHLCRAHARLREYLDLHKEHSPRRTERRGDWPLQRQRGGEGV